MTTLYDLYTGGKIRADAESIQIQMPLGKRFFSFDAFSEITKASLWGTLLLGLTQDLATAKVIAESYQLSDFKNSVMAIFGITMEDVERLIRCLGRDPDLNLIEERLSNWLDVLMSIDIAEKRSGGNHVRS